MTIYEEADIISRLPQPVRLAGYLRVLAENAEVGARLRLSKKDEDWTEQDRAEWEASCEKMEPYWFSLSEKEIEALKEVHAFTGTICRGENL